MKTAKQQLSRNPSNAGYSTPLKTYSVPAVENEDKTISVPAQPVYLIDPTIEPIPIGANAMIPTRAPGVNTFNAAIGGIGATGRALACPAGQRWKMLAIVCEVTATATVGNRILQMRVRSGGANPMWIGAASTAVAAAQVGGYDISFGSPLNTPSTTVRRNIANTANTNVQVREAAPALELMPGDDIVIDDSADIDNADGVIMYASYLRYDI